MKFFKKILPFLIALLFAASSASAASIFTVPQGGTGVNTITGIIQGNGTSPFSAVTIGAGLNFSGGTLSNTGTVPILNNAQIAFGDVGNLMTSSGDLIYDPSTTTFSVGFAGQPYFSLQPLNIILSSLDGAGNFAGVQFQGDGVNTSEFTYQLASGNSATLLYTPSGGDVNANLSSTDGQNTYLSNVFLDSVSATLGFLNDTNGNNAGFNAVDQQTIVGMLNSTGNNSYFRIRDSIQRFSMSSGGNDYFLADVGANLYQFGNINTGYQLYINPAGNQSILTAGATSLTLNNSSGVATIATTNGLIVSNLAGFGTESVGVNNTGNLFLTTPAAPLVGKVNLTGRTGASTATILTIPVPGFATTYSIGSYLTVTAISAGTVSLTVQYTDETSVIRTVTIGSATTVSLNSFNDITIRALAGSNVVIQTKFTGVSTTYDVGAYVLVVS